MAAIMPRRSNPADAILFNLTLALVIVGVVAVYDASYARALDVGSHDGRMINRALELAREHSTSFEFAMLQGVRDPLKRELVAQGHRVSEYIPYGPNWLPYFSRRLRERPKNIVTMVRSFVES